MTNYNGTIGNDEFTGTAGNETAVGNGGDDTLNGGAGFDLLVGNSGSDTLNGGDDEDTLYSGDESPPYGLPYYDNPFVPPLLDAGVEVDTLNGGDGSDILFGGYGDNIDGGSDGAYGDYLFISFLGAASGVTADFRLSSQIIGGGTITDIENISWVQGSNYDDTLDVRTAGNNGYSDFNVVYGMGGDDHLIAGYYTGVLYGGAGNDIVDGLASQYLQAVYGDEGDDTIYMRHDGLAKAFGGAGDDTIYSDWETHGGSGNDFITMSYSYYGPARVTGDAGDDTIQAAGSGALVLGGAGADTLLGDAQRDSLYADSDVGYDLGIEHDVLAGFGNDDTLSVGYGDDADGGSGTDSLFLSFGGAPDGVTFDAQEILSGVSVVVFGGTINSIERLAYLGGSAFADVLDSSVGNDIVSGLAGDDFLSGHAGVDTLIGGVGADTLDGGADTDTASYATALSAVSASLTTNTGTLGDALGDVFISIERLAGSAFNDTLTGNTGTNKLIGGAGNDILDGGGGADTLEGGSGNDTYFTDGGDTIKETDSAGTDTVKTSLTYVLGANLEKLTLTGAAAVNATGNDLVNTLTGNAGNNILDGKFGADVMSGGDGDDTYVVDDIRDTVTESSASGGTDRVNSSVSFAIKGYVEKLILTGTAAIDGTGSSHDNILIGNSGANILDGKGGADTMAGGSGDDTYIVDNAGDITKETSKTGGLDWVMSSVTRTLSAYLDNLALTGSHAINGTGNSLGNVISGNSAVNSLDGGSGVDVLNGGLGNDILTGGTGFDLFVFNTAVSSTNRDRITDFSHSDDAIILDHSVFTALSAGGFLNSNAFYVGAGAHDATDRIIYNSATGALIYDSNGSAAGGAIQIATLSTGLTTLDYTDFTVF